MKQCLQRLGVDNEGKVVETQKLFDATLWHCVSCKPPLCLRTKSIVGHSHRHASLMQVEIISEVAPSVMNPQLNLFGLAR